MHKLGDINQKTIAGAVEFCRKIVKIDFVRFCIVGGVGFLVHSSIFFTLKNVLGVPAELAYLIGAEGALFSNFTAHHFWTYKNIVTVKRKRVLLREFHASFWTGALINFGVFVIIIRICTLPDIIGLIGGSIAALLWNFFWTKRVIWRESTTD